ncbi:unnamed protein product [Menidia menidia]|uniref:(Atlantic silverside) hypothetical protein n=1 Tax=Menidia menidia TaxID=238744 RepID=A0A8S4AJF9_9TELE|nr:unnamed protein product [Menidia menidia]CAG5867036.1 unnamed protein product [Menidia menidia]
MNIPVSSINNPTAREQYKRLREMDALELNPDSEGAPSNEKQELMMGIWIKIETVKISRMDTENTVNKSYILNAIHPCYELDNETYTFKQNPSVMCVLLYMFLGSLCVVTVCGNLLVIISIFYFRQLHTPTNYLILSLAVADLLVGILVFPSSMVFTVSSCLFHEDLFCKVRDSFDVTLCTSSILNLCFISIDRYYAVCQPLTYRAKINAQVTVVMILVSWGVSVLIGIGITLAGFSQGTCEEMCSVDTIVANTMGPVFSFYFPAVIMLCIYFKIFLVAQQQAKSIQTTNCHNSLGATVSKMERKATKTLAIVMGVFLLCLTPYFICVVFLPLSNNPPPVPVIEALNWLTLSNSMLNPLIYAFFYSWFSSGVDSSIRKGNKQQQTEEYFLERAIDLLNTGQEVDNSDRMGSSRGPGPAPASQWQFVRHRPRAHQTTWPFESCFPAITPY